MSRSIFGRRTVLKQIGTASVAATTGVVGKVAGRKPGAEEIYAQSLRLRSQNDWDVNQWRTYLLKRGLDFGFQDRSYRVPNAPQNGGGGDGIGTQKLDWGNCDLRITFTEYTDVTGSTLRTIDFDWGIHVDWYYENEDGVRPVDNAAISWDSDDYILDGDPYYGDNVSKIKDKNSETSSGVVVNFDDYLNFHNDSDEYMDSYFGVHVDDDSSSTKEIYVDYYHTWASASLTSISFGTGGVSLGFDSTETWVRETQISESDIKQNSGSEYYDCGAENSGCGQLGP